MGLGKTLQAIAFMAWLQGESAANRRPAAPLLIVAPTGLLGNWQAEIRKHLNDPWLGPIAAAFGGDLKRLREESGLGGRDIETGRAALDSGAWRQASVVLTTYETLRDYHFSFARTRFSLIVYDEIQKLKNPTSQMTRAAKTLNAAFVLGMTGTPVENRLQDLWSLMDVIAPGLLGSSREFEKKYPADDRMALANLKSLLMGGDLKTPPFMVRRLKSDALEGLPKKTVVPYQVEMPAAQAQAYKDVVVRAAAAAASGTLGKGGMLTFLAAMRKNRWVIWRASRQIQHELKAPLRCSMPQALGTRRSLCSSKTWRCRTVSRRLFKHDMAFRIVRCGSMAALQVQPGKGWWIVSRLTPIASTSWSSPLRRAVSA
jgi:SNF2 family DNA or RNA helicase